MVDKVDRPEAPPTWRIKEPSRTKDDRHSQQQEESKEQKKKKFEKREEGRWQKFDSRTMVIRPIRIALRDIRTILYRNVNFHSGITTLECDVHYTNGRTTEGAIIRLGGFEAYTRVKRLQPGSEVPRELWAKSDPIEVGIPQERGYGGAFPGEELERDLAQREELPKRKSISWLSLIGLKSKKTGKFQWATLILYLLIATGLGLAIHAILTMTRVY